MGDDEDFIAGDELIRRLANLCQELNAKAMQIDENAVATVMRVVERLPKLMDGLLVNCRFSGCKDFEYFGDMDLFDVFGLKLYHAWVEPEIAKIVSSWNVLEERLVVCAELRMALEREGRKPTETEDATLTQGLLLAEWSEDTCMQATARGLEELSNALHEDDVAVLFRNNHFSAICKPSQAPTCALITDIAFEDLPSAVWESVELNGAASVYDGDLCLYDPDNDAEPCATELKKVAGKSRAKPRKKKR